MSPDFNDYVNFANDNPVCYLATADGDQPHVRPIKMWFADGTGFYYHTQSVKQLTRQLKANPRVEIAFYRPGEEGDLGLVMRVTGQVEILRDAATLKRLVDEVSYINPPDIAEPNPRVTAFRVVKGEAFFWRRADSPRETEIPRVRF